MLQSQQAPFGTLPISLYSPLRLSAGPENLPHICIEGHTKGVCGELSIRLAFWFLQAGRKGSGDLSWVFCVLAVTTSHLSDGGVCGVVASSGRPTSNAHDWLTVGRNVRFFIGGLRAYQINPLLWPYESYRGTFEGTTRMIQLGLKPDSISACRNRLRPQVGRYSSNQCTAWREASSLANLM